MKKGNLNAFFREKCLTKNSINEQNFLTLLCQSYAQIDRRSGLADTAFLVCQSDYFAI